jgi:hypothetical protein
MFQRCIPLPSSVEVMMEAIHTSETSCTSMRLHDATSQIAVIFTVPIDVKIT